MHQSAFQDLISHGEHLFHTGHMHEALQVFASVLSHEPQNVLALNNRGVILHGLGISAEAEQAFLDILHQDKNNANAVVNLVTLYIEQYNIHSAEDMLIKYGHCLSMQDIQELKDNLYNIKNEINVINTLERTKILDISMDVNEKKHAFKLCLNTREASHRAIYECFDKHELYKPELSNFFASVLQENDGFIDIGAHVGYFSLLGATLVGRHGHVLAFEPEENNYRYLHENIALSNFSNIETCKTALGVENKTSKIFVNTDNHAGHALWNVGRHPDYINSRMHCVTRDVQVASLDSLLQSVQMPNIKLMNIDTCGAEFDVIQGAVSTLENYKVPYVVCGIHRFGLQQMGTSEQELRQFMGYMGYETYCIRAEAPHLVSLAPAQCVASQYDFHVLFARPPFPGETHAAPHA